MAPGKKLGFKDQDAFAKAHKSIDLRYLRQVNRMATRLLHDSVFEHPTKDTAAQTKRPSSAVHHFGLSLLSHTRQARPLPPLFLSLFSLYSLSLSPPSLPP